MIDNWLIEEVYVSTPRYSLFVFVLNDISNTISNIKQFACRNIVYAVVRTNFCIKIYNVNIFVRFYNLRYGIYLHASSMFLGNLSTRHIALC